MTNIKPANRLRLAFKLAAACLICLSIASTACDAVRERASQVLEGTDEERRNKLNLPQNAKHTEMMSDLILPEEDCIITVADEGGTVLMGEDAVAEGELAAKISEKLKDKTPDKRIVYFESASNVQYGTIAKFLIAVRQAKPIYIGLVVLRKRQDGGFDDDFGFLVKPSKVSDLSTVPAKPNPLFLQVSIEKDGNLLLNREETGTISNTEMLTERLSNVFKNRESNGVFREGTNEVEKTVFIKSVRSMDYGSVVGVIDAVKGSGAEPIMLWLDDLL